MAFRYLTIGAVSLVLAIPSLPASAYSPGWVDECPYSHSGVGDPFHAGGSQGAALHDFFGAKDTDTSSTIRSMRRGGTTCQAADTAGYWVPALFENGHRVLPTGSRPREQVYYRDNNLRRGTHITVFPRGMELIAGNPEASSRASNDMLGSELYWGCSNDRPGGRKHKHPISCASGIISLHVGFPNCWDGQHRSMVRAENSVVYPIGGRCPASHPVKLPRVIERWEYPVGTSTGHIRLSSGPPYTVYGEFWNTWGQHALKRLVTHCLNADKNCGTFFH